MLIILIRQIFVLLLSITMLSCSLIPNDSNSIKDVSLEGKWQSTYLRAVQIIMVEGNPTEFEQTSILTIEKDHYRFVFNPPASQTIIHFDLIEEISGIFTISKDTILFYDSTGQNVLQELFFSITHDSLSITYPIIVYDTLDNGLVRGNIPLSGLPWGYAMNIWKPFIKIDTDN